MTPTLSVVIPTKNRPVLLSEALDSVAAQRSSDVEVIVVNDGGAPVLDVVRRYQGILPVRVLDLETSNGPSRARNAALDVVEGDFVGFLDDDDIFLPGHVGLTMKALADSGAQFCASPALLFDRRIPAAEIVTARPSASHGYVNNLDVLDIVNPFVINGVVCASPRKNGARFDVSLSFCEDWDMWLRLIKGFDYAYVNQPVPTTVYFRPPAMQSATNAAGVDSDALMQTYRHYLQICDRWPVGQHTQAAKLRIFFDLVYAISFKRMAIGKPVPHFYFNAVAAAFSESLLGDLSDADLRRRIFTAMDEPAVEF